MSSNKNASNQMSQTDLDKLCFQVKDILRNYGKQQTAEGQMLIEVIMEYLIFIKFFDEYSPELHGERRLSVYDKMVQEDPSLVENTFKSFMEPWFEDKKSKKSVTDEMINDVLIKEHMLHEYLSLTYPTNTLFGNTLSLYKRLEHEKCAIAILEVVYLSSVKLDDVGDIHEYFIQDEAKTKSKMYGQFFTPNEICMKAMDLVQPKLRADGSIPDCLDPAAGSFKFMRNLAKHLSETSGKPYAEILLNHCYGCEIEKKAHRSLLYNIVMETGDISSNVYHANSLKYLMYGKVNGDSGMSELDEYDTEKRYDYIFANPPFGCKTELGMVQEHDKQTVDKKTKAIGKYPMKTKNSDGMFLQLIIHLLKDGGEACIVMCGSIFNKDWISLRKYWMENCVIKSITVCPKDSFKNTSIESYLIHFEKGGKTEEVKYHHFNEGLIGTRSAFDETYDLSVPRSNMSEQQCSGIVTTLSQLCDINKVKADRNKFDEYKYIEISSLDDNGQVQATSVSKTDLPSRAQLFANVGDILFGSVRPNLKRHIYVTQDIYADNLVVSTGFFVLTPKDNVDGYFLYNLLCGQEFTDTCMQYANKKAMYPSVNRDDLSQMSIQVPSYNIQKYSSSKLRMLDHNISLTKQKIEADKEYMKILLETETRDCEKVRLGDVCDIKQGEFLAAEKRIEGQYPIYGGGLSSKTHNKFNKQGGQIVIPRVGNPMVNWVSEEFFLTDNGFCLDPKTNDNTLKRYMYYVMLSLIATPDLYNGTAQKKTTKGHLGGLMIPIPKQDVMLTLVNELDAIEMRNNDELRKVLQIDALKNTIINSHTKE